MILIHLQFESKFGEDEDKINVGGTQKERPGNTLGWKKA